MLLPILSFFYQFLTRFTLRIIRDPGNVVIIRDPNVVSISDPSIVVIIRDPNVVIISDSSNLVIIRDPNVAIITVILVV